MNGNVNNLENDKHFDQTTEISVNVNSVGTVCRNHFQNYCLTHDQKFSCAVDCFLELCYGIFSTRLHNVTRNEFFDIIYESCNSRQLFGAVETVREPVWSSIRNRCPSFLGMTANAVFSDIFTMRNVGSLSDDLKSLFLIQQRSQTCCSLCTNQIVKTAGIMVLYITSPNLRSIDFENQLSEAVLPDTGALYCDSCQSQTGDIRMQHFITMPMFLMTELSAIHINQIQFPLNIDVLGNFYSLKAVVRCASHHFTVAINSGTSWLYYDDLCMEVAEYHNFQDLLTLFSNGWFFAVYEKSCMPFTSDLHGQNLSGLSGNVPENSFLLHQSPLFTSSVQCKEDLKSPINNSVDKLGNRKRRMGYMKEYMKQRKKNESEIEKVDRQKRQNKYQKEYIKRSMSNDQSREKPCNKRERAQYMRDYRKRKKLSDVNLNQPVCNENVHNSLDKQTYLSQFEGLKNGPIHEQKWAKKNMQNFHNSMKFKIFRCDVCCEAWPLSEKSKVKVPYICTRCIRDKSNVKKFSLQNNMIPSQVPVELQGLTQLEEMLIG